MSPMYIARVVQLFLARTYTDRVLSVRLKAIASSIHIPIVRRLTIVITVRPVSAHTSCLIVVAMPASIVAVVCIRSTLLLPIVVHFHTAEGTVSELSFRA